MNIAHMMKQAQQMQQRLKDTQASLAETLVEAEAGNGAVKVTCDGHGRFKSIKLSAEAICPENPSSVDVETIEMLEDLITNAMNAATKEAVQGLEKKMKEITGGISIPGLL